MWPAVAVLALVLGVGGGVAGSVDLPPRPATRHGLATRRHRSGAGVRPAPSPSAPLKRGKTSVAAVAQELLPSTVQISAEYEGEASGATGSGFVLDEAGHIITNNHVVEQAAEDDGPIEIVDQDGNRYDATVVGRSPVYDLAVLFSEEAKEMKPAALGESLALHVGDPVVAIGSPLGLSSTVTAGHRLRAPAAGHHRRLGQRVVVHQRRPDRRRDQPRQLRRPAGQPARPGRRRELRDRHHRRRRPAATGSGNIGVGFAIPIEQVKVTADQILRTGEARYPVIGARVQTGQRDGYGAEIDSVVDGTPADDAGLEEGDVVVALEGQRVTDGIALIVSIRSHQPGETLTFTVVRDGDEKDIKVTLDSEVG